MTLHCRHAPDATRYELLDDDELVGIADYVRAGTTTIFTHTEVSPSRRGEGLGEQLVQFALDDERRAGNLVVARCWFVDEYIDEHPEYADLRAPSRT
jgi:uncharacterized protein